MSAAAKAVFLSYAREDTDAARRIADALRSHGVEVWFDQSELRGGDTWDQKIRKQINDCTLFLPVISQHTQDRSKGYFRLEWKLAVEQTHLMLEGVPFLAPVVVDDTLESGAAVPAEFMRVQWTRLPGALPTPQFVAQIKRLLDGPDKDAPGARPAPVAAAPASAASPPTRMHLWLAAVVGVALLGAVTFFALRPAANEPAASPPVVSQPAPVAPATDNSVAVLAFADLSEARNSEYLSDGISENLLDALAKVPGLRVAARTSAFYFKGKNLPMAEIAQKLNVAYVVEGSVQRAGDSVRITAQLIKAADGYHVWSDHFDRELKNIFAVQDEIAGLIAKQLSLKLGASSAAATAAVNPEAFELYVQARQAWNQRTLAAYDRAEELLNRALTLEPKFARAHAALADVWVIRAVETGKINTFGQRNSPEFARLRAQVDRALALDPNLAEAHATLGNLLMFNGQFEESARELRLALALNPNYATGHHFLGRLLQSDGQFDEARDELARAAALDPFSPRILDNYAILLEDEGRSVEALPIIDRALTLQPDSLQAAIFKAATLSSLGRHDDAVALVRRQPYKNPFYVPEVVKVLVRAGLKQEAEQLLAGIPGGTNYRALAAIGRPVDALAAMDPAKIPISIFSLVFIDPAFDPIRQDPRYVALIAELGMTEAHARARAWRAAHPLPKTK